MILSIFHLRVRKQLLKIYFTISKIKPPKGLDKKSLMLKISNPFGSKAIKLLRVLGMLFKFFYLLFDAFHHCQGNIIHHKRWEGSLSYFPVHLDK